MPEPAELARLCVVLVNTRNPLNIGAAARAMSNFGFADLRLVQPFEASFQEARSAVGAADLLAGARRYESVAEAVADCSLVVGTTSGDRRRLELELKPLGQAGALVRRSGRRGRVAVLFGSEKRGLSNADFSHCHWLLRIPTREGHGSMNLGQAVAVCLYEFARQAGKKRAGKKRTAETGSVKIIKTGPAKATDLERLTAILLDSLRLSGYLSPRSSGPTDEKIRQMVRRLDLKTGDAERWLGMLRQIHWKLNGEP